jgi:CheY-like chemotaxis protein
MVIVGILPDVAVAMVQLGLTLEDIPTALDLEEGLVARDGVEALDYLLGRDAARREPLPGLVLLDLKLPKLDGLEVLRRIRAAERTRLLPVVILTSSAEERDILEGYRLGTNSYARKPADLLEFAEAVRQLGLYWLLLNRPPPTSGIQ